MSIVNTCWGQREIIDQVYWHLIPPSGFNAEMFKNNVRVGKGALLSVSASIAAEPHIKNAHTPYSLSNIGDLKERLFEEVRQNKFSCRPSRLKTLYVFDEYSLVERALKEWFQGNPKEIYECRIINGANIFRADTNWLNCAADQWQERASRYWNGEMSENSFPEALVHGALYFPNWLEFAA
jgi:hypothetical protein